MSTDTQAQLFNSSWNFPPCPRADPMDFLQFPASERVDATNSQLPTPPRNAVSPLTSPLLTYAQDTFAASAQDVPSSSTVAEDTVPVSTTFYPGADINTNPPNIILLSSDSVFFYLHSNVLLGASSNGFNGLIPYHPDQCPREAGSLITVAEHSTVLNIILHTVYDMSCSHYAPSFESLSSAVAALPKYGISVQQFIVPSTPLYTLLLSYAPLHPIEVYALAAKYDAYDLAVTTSSHLLSFSLASLTDEMAAQMGPKYLKRLFFLHLGRLEVLKRLLLPPPPPHASTDRCNFEDQKRLTRAWGLASAYLAWDARPDLSTSAIQSALGTLEGQLSCNLCRESFRERLNNIIVQWSVIKRTI